MALPLFMVMLMVMSFLKWMLSGEGNVRWREGVPDLNRDAVKDYILGINSPNKFAGTGSASARFPDGDAQQLRRESCPTSPTTEKSSDCRQPCAMRPPRSRWRR